MKWYSVDEYDPIVGALYLVACNDKRVFVASYEWCDKFYWVRYLDDFEFCDVTHFALIDPIPLAKEVAS